MNFSKTFILKCRQAAVTSDKLIVGVMVSLYLGFSVTFYASSNILSFKRYPNTEASPWNEY